MSRRWLGVAAVVGTLVVAGCQRTAQGPPQEDGQIVHVTANEFAFEPKEIAVKAGRVKFLVKNEGAVEHDFMIVGVAEHGNEHGTETFQPGEVYTLTVDLKPGTYDIVCGVAGHKEEGMTATLVAAP